MTDSKKSNKLSGILIVGGAAVFVITLGGAYLSQNPDLISSWQYKRESARHDEMAQRIFTAPASCAGLKTSVFTEACPKLDLDFEQLNWKEGLTEADQSCLLESYNDVARYRLEYNKRPLKNLKNMQDDMSIILHACFVGSDLENDNPDVGNKDAMNMLNSWYEWKHSEGNYFQ